MIIDTQRTMKEEALNLNDKLTEREVQENPKDS